MRAGLYARYSTDLQSASSTADQFRVCEARAADMTVVARHADDGISGSTPVAKRPGGRALMADALAGRFDVLIVESLDRLSRDSVDLEGVVRRFEHRGIRIIGVSDGYDSHQAGRKVIRAVRGIVNELYLDDLRAKTHRGLAGQFARGFIASGRSYGYRIVKAEAGSRYAVDEDEARWVRHVFRRFASGDGVQSIVYDLNARGVRSARGGDWAVSAVYGSPTDGSGMLNNLLYAGELVWNRSQWLKDPDTGRRQRILRPAHEWQIQQVPELRIVDEVVWQAARSRIASTRRAATMPGGRAPRTLFGGLLLCPHCGAPLIAINATRYGCNRRKDRGPTACPGFSLSRRTTDSRLLSTIREDLLAPEAAAAFAQELRAATDRLGSADTDARRRLQALDDEIVRLVDAMVKVGASDALAARLRESEAERRRLAQVRSAAVPPPNPAMMFSQLLLQLQDAIAEEPERGRAVLSKLIPPVPLRVNGERVEGLIDTGMIVELAAGGSIAGVAGAGFEPTTFGL
ncbi:MAG: recombinase family protein [Lautropia sp.]